MECEACGKRNGQILVDETHYVCNLCAPKFTRSNPKKKKCKKKTYQIMEFQRRFREK